ncbi:helix-turn-helix transcriptional regulator [Dyadobacter psychrotolerans]|uniref:LuxR family transcriptional regulator n=1 Tax=Dyadobacter psychrotolerans TaxID=2541721 RepID=A0A4R5DXB9_9BACT|nr:LuxR C-terminal-related transcriptional regulator [Dyadobacter psychrotolerans]TDE17090.1 LuxR family transcriptional regulator [Dyadobacter psychrotolerans]
MNHSEHYNFDLTSFRKIWKSDILESEISDIQGLLSENPLLNETLFLRKSSLAIIDLRTMRYTCSFGDIEQVCGLKKEVILREGVAYFVSKLPPSDYLGLQKMSELMGKYVADLSNEMLVTFKGMFDFLMVQPDGSFRRIIQEGVALKRDANGNILFLLALVSDITNMKREGRQHLRLTDGIKDLIYEVDCTGLNTRKLESLSTREVEIAKLIGQKFTSEEIAKKLFLSGHTINTHRQNMLRKLDMADTMELINFLGVYQLI